MMATMPWIKLYTKILNDPKVGMLSSTEFTTFIKLLLIAAELGKSDGHLKKSEGWLTHRVHQSTDKFHPIIVALLEKGLLGRDNMGLLFIPNLGRYCKLPFGTPDTRRKFREKTQGGGWIAKEWETLKSQYHHRCARCHRHESEIGILEADHIIPLALGGAHNIGNIQPLCKFCNCSKGIKILDFREERGNDARPDA